MSREPRSSSQRSGRISKRRPPELAPAAAVASTSERLDARDAELETLERRFHQASTRVDTLADSVSARVSGAEEHLSALRAHVEEGGVRLDALAAAVASASERLDARDVELETLERRFHDAGTRVDTLADSVSARVSGAEEQLSALRAHVEEGGVHLNSLAAAVASTSERLDARDAELETPRAPVPRREHARRRARRRALSSARRVPRSGIGEAGARIAPERARPCSSQRPVRVEELADRLESSVATLAGRAPEIEELDRRLDDLVTRIDAVDDDRAGPRRGWRGWRRFSRGRAAGVALEARIARRRTGGGPGRSRPTSWRRASPASPAGSKRSSTSAALAARVSRLASAFDTERTSFQTQLEALAAALSWASPRSSVDERLEELDQRMRDLERDSTAVASRVSRATTLLPTRFVRWSEARRDRTRVARDARLARPFSRVRGAQRARAARRERRARGERRRDDGATHERRRPDPGEPIPRAVRDARRAAADRHNTSSVPRAAQSGARGRLAYRMLVNLASLEQNSRR